MTYIPKIVQRALELIQDRYSAEKVAAILSTELKDELKTPCAKTIRRWEKEAAKWEKQRAESKENAREFFKTHPVPKWLENVYLVKIENGEIKPL